jgi:hypothetical protein
MPETPRQKNDAVTTPVGVTTICPQCGVMLDALTTTCGACGAVITDAGTDTGRADKVRAKLQEAIGDAFVVGGLLGRGGMGIVYRARETALDRDVALKVLAFDPVLNPDAYARFEREAKLAARLDHPHIVPIFSVGQRAGVAFYTMRLVKGGSVEQLIEPGHGMALDRALAILHDVGAALDYAHANGVVHRDVKPANILIGDSGHAMVADFGIARAFGGDAAATATGTGVVGSPAYMSPEQWRGEKVDGRTDQYALGVLAFELLTGTRPFADASMQQLLQRHLTEEPPDVVSFRGDLPSHSTDALRHAMAKDPADRFVSATAFVDALEGTARPRPSVKSPRVKTARIPAPVEAAARRRSVWPAVLLLLLLGGAAGAMVVVRMNDRKNAALLGASAAAAAAPFVDSIAALQKAEADENAKLQKEVDDARTAALAAEHKVELMSQAQAAKRAAPAASKGEVAPPAPVEAPHAHVIVLVRGGAPSVFIDGQRTVNNAPTVVEVPPGHHVVSVRGAGGNQFTPAEYSLDLAPEDTQQVIFVSQRVAQAQSQRQKAPEAGDPGSAAASAGAGAAPGTDTAGRTATQRQRYQKLQQAMDSIRRAKKPPA